MSPFERNKVIRDVHDISRLAEKLSKSPEVARFNQGDHREEWALAGSFADLEESFRIFIDDQLPKLTNGTLSDEELSGLLIQIGVNFQHVLYHILTQPKFYNYLKPGSE